jgi:predicted acyl esterase
VRLDISSSNFPHFDINPNSGEDEGHAEKMRIATNRVYLDRDHCSLVRLPLIPTRT